MPKRLSESVSNWQVNPANLEILSLPEWTQDYRIHQDFFLFPAVSYFDCFGQGSEAEHGERSQDWTRGEQDESVAPTPSVVNTRYQFD
jgi:hypothetical protein